MSDRNRDTIQNQIRFCFKTIQSSPSAGRKFLSSIDLVLHYLETDRKNIVE